MGTEKVQFNLRNVHWAHIVAVENGKITYEKPVPWPGAVKLNVSRKGSAVEFIADGALYYVSYTNEGLSGTLEMALIPDEFRKTILNEKEDETDHVLVEYANAATEPFALLFEVDTDKRASRRVLYYCTAGSPGENANGQAQRNPQTEELQITASPLADGRVKARTKDNTVDDVYNNWFEKVWEPETETAPDQDSGGEPDQAAVDGGPGGNVELNAQETVDGGQGGNVELSAQEPAEAPSGQEV